MQSTTSTQAITYTYADLWISSITGAAHLQAGRGATETFVVMRASDADTVLAIDVHRADFDALVEAGWESGDRVHFGRVSDHRDGFIAGTAVLAD